MKTLITFDLPGQDHASLGEALLASAVEDWNITGNQNHSIVVFDRSDDGNWVGQLAGDLAAVDHPAAETMVERLIRGTYQCETVEPDFDAITMADMFEAMRAPQLQEAIDLLLVRSGIDGKSTFFDDVDHEYWPQEGVQAHLEQLTSWLLAVAEGRA